ncbi:YlxR family protein [Mycoplasma procyoni]|uniref:YlxR family protein n=1 Tax=Mycoplasma procyoni TaxID=568784 RepID=UPI00197B2F9F|nr:YlxR family protein [Mycoplasma procyoni]MBN3535032.1 YlxR family protein [Mycoplasma procyoni]
MKSKSHSRKCIVTNSILPIEQLLRFVLDKETNTILVDFDNKIQGRGAYVINSKETIQIAFSKKHLNRSFRMNVTKENYEKLTKEIEEHGEKK